MGLTSYHKKMDKYRLKVTQYNMLFSLDKDRMRFANIIAPAGLVCMITVALSLHFLFYKVADAQFESVQDVNNTSGISTTISNSTLYASGNAETKVKPDKVVLSLAVETTNKTANAALIANSDIMTRVLTALKAAGVKDNETSTSFFNISPNHNNTEPAESEIHPGGAGNIKSYTVTNSINIESFNLANVSQWIDAAVTAGANNVNNIYFTLSDERQRDTENTLLKQAIDNAKNKADIAASALGLRVLGVTSINLNVGYQPPLPLFKQEAFAREVPSATSGSASATPIITGQQEVTTNVDVVFKIG